MTFYYYFLSVAHAREGNEGGRSPGWDCCWAMRENDKRDMLRGYFTTPESSKSDDIDLVRDIKRRDVLDGFVLEIFIILRKI